MNEMFMRSRGQVSGPFSVDEIKAKIARGEIVPLHELSYDGVEWVRAGKIWDEFVPKPKSMIEMAEQRPIPQKPLVQPVDIHETLSHRRRSSHVEPPKSAAPSAPSPVSKPARVAESTPAATNGRPLKEAPATPPASAKPPDDLVEATDDDLAPADKPRPEPAIGVRLIRTWAVGVGCFALVWIVLSVACIVLNLRLIEQLRPPTLDQLRKMLAPGLFDMSSVVQAWTLIIGAVFGMLFLVWIYFSAHYLFLKTEGRMRFTPVWAVAWFLIPFANLWKPYKVVGELQRRSEQFLRFDDPRIIHEPIVKIWWSCCLLQFAAGFFANSRSTLELKQRLDEAATPDDLAKLERLPELFAEYFTLEIVSHGTGIATAIATLVLMYKLEKVRPKWETRGRRRRTV